MNLHNPFSHHRGLTGAMHYTGASASIIMAVAAAAQAGISIYSNVQQADNAKRMAEYNAAIQRQNADVNARVAMHQADANARAAEAQYRAQQNNAVTLENQAVGVEAQAREKARRLREEQDRALAVQRGKFAKAGVVNEGSPLVVLADTARLTELKIHDSLYESEQERTDYLRQAEDQRYRSGFSLLEAQNERYKGATAAVARKIAYHEADLTAYAGKAQAEAYYMNANADLISGAAGVVGSFASMGGVGKTTVGTKVPGNSSNKKAYKY